HGRHRPEARQVPGRRGRQDPVHLQEGHRQHENCTGGCAQAWPPFALDAGEQVKAGAGITGTLTTFARADGKMQVAYNGAPLYYYATDTKAGDVMGQGVGGFWFAAKP